jgi:hypothetical protein
VTRVLRLTMLLASGVTFISFFDDEEIANEVLKQVEPYVVRWLAWEAYETTVN